MNENPFASPEIPDHPNSPQSPHTMSDGRIVYGRAYVRQISVVSILMIVHGVLLIIMTAFLAAASALYANLDKFEPEGQSAPIPPELQAIMTWGAGIFAVMIFMLAILSIVTGISNFNLRARTLGITTLILSIAAALTFYCGITAIPLAIYGMVIYFNPASAEAFRLRKTGLSKQEVLNRFVH